MDDNAPPAEYVSDDGQWIWNGYQWVPHTAGAGMAGRPIGAAVPAAGQPGEDPVIPGSEPSGAPIGTEQGFPPGSGQPEGTADSDWYWDGQQWLPANPNAMPPTSQVGSTKKPNPLLIIAGVAGLVIVALISVWLLTRDSGTGESAAPPNPDTTQTLPSDGGSDVMDPGIATTPFPPDFPTEAPLTADPLNPDGTATGQLPLDQAAAAVNWTRFTPGTRERVDAAAATANCAELANLRATASANDATVAAATGTGTADLVAYIQAQESVTGCTAVTVP